MLVRFSVHSVLDEWREHRWYASGNYCNIDRMTDMPHVHVASKNWSVSSYLQEEDDQIKPHRTSNASKSLLFKFHSRRKWKKIDRWTSGLANQKLEWLWLVRGDYITSTGWMDRFPYLLYAHFLSNVVVIDPVWFARLDVFSQSSSRHRISDGLGNKRDSENWLLIFIFMVRQISASASTAASRYLGQSDQSSPHCSHCVLTGQTLSIETQIFVD